MNKLIIIGILLLVAGISAHYLMDTINYGFWIGALMGGGGGLLLIGLSKKFS